MRSLRYRVGTKKWKHQNRKPITWVKENYGVYGVEKMRKGR